MPLRAGYYRCTDEHEEIPVGKIVYAVQGEQKDQIAVLIDTGQYTYSLDDFDQCYEYHPEGAAEHQARVNGLMAEIDKAELDFNDLSVSMLEFRPHAAGDQIAGDGALVASDSPHTPATVKRAVAKVRNTVAKTKKALDIKRKELTELIEARTQALQLRVTEMNRMVDEANKAIWTINLYMGKDEEIHRLAEGELAPKEEPISLRQRVLYMDEECADLSDDQGIDVSQLDVFDEWLLKDNNLYNLLPEPKGLVCLHARSREKKYQDPWVSAQMNAANRQYTYFLIRNGDNVYRIYADIVLGSVMFPDAKDYERIFRKTEFDWETHSKKTKVLRPGDDEYMEAMSRCEKKQMHYLRVLLILQGLIDRTNVFKPLPVEHINICNKADYFEFLRFVYDTGEAVLDDGKPSFSNWLNGVNENLEVGHRIVGAFNSYKAGLRGASEGGSRYGIRVHPENAELPKTDSVYTITRAEKARHESDRYFFSYDREIWDKYDGYRQSFTKGSCYVKRKDQWIIDIDAVEITDMEYYLSSRKGKSEYEYMVPTMELALKMKRKEIEDEEPFRQLLASQISQAHSVDLKIALASTEELVKWWKLKNRTHRALLSDDRKALDMIVAEFGIRQKRDKERANLAVDRDAVINAVRKHAEPIVVAHKSKNKYVAYVAHNDDNVWVREQIWTLNRTTGAVYMNEDKEWRLVDKRHIRWEIVYKTERWDSWAINPRKATVMTDPEIAGLIERALRRRKERFEEEINESRSRGRGRRGRRFSSIRPWDRDRRRAQRFLPLAGGIDNHGNIKVWFSDQGPILPNGRLFSRRPHSPVVEEVGVHSWTRKKDKITFYLGSSSVAEGEPWDYGHTKKRSRFDHGGTEYKVVCRFDKNIDQIRQERQKAEELEEARAEMIKASGYSEAAQKYAREKQERAYFDEFLADHGDLELWEDHKEGLEFTSIWGYQVDIACALLLERGIDIIGMKLGDIIEQALPMGLLNHKKGFENHYDKVDPNLPLDFVIPPQPEEEEEEYEEEDD